MYSDDDDEEAGPLVHKKDNDLCELVAEIAKDIKLMRTTRRMGMIPNPNIFTGERKKLALEMSDLFARLNEIDNIIFDNDPDSRIKK